MTSLAKLKKRQLLGYGAFAVVALVCLGFWAIELRVAMQGFDEREREAVAEHHRRALDVRAEALRDLFHEIYQTGRTISLLPAIREVTGPNRASVHEDAIAQGRLPAEIDRALKQIYANLAAYVQVSEIYLVMDGFDPARGEVPFFMYDDLVSQDGASRTQRPGSDTPDEDETQEYAEIVRQLEWFRTNAPRFVYASDLNRIPARASAMVRTCDNTQYTSLSEGNVRDASGVIVSIPVYDAATGLFKAQISIILRSNVLEAKLIDVPFLPITGADQQRMGVMGWKMPPPSSFVLIEKTHGIEIADRRQLVLEGGWVAAVARTRNQGDWASRPVDVPTVGSWELHHFLSDAEVAQLVGPIHQAKRMSIIGRALLLALVTAILAGGARLVRSARRELMRMAHTDQLTGLPNRRLFFDRLESAIARARRHGTRTGLFFMDLADLNAINDRHGHQGGDQLLVEVAHRVLAQLSVTDTVMRDDNPSTAMKAGVLPKSAGFLLSRVGGDEFTVLCEGLRSPDDLITVAERIVECLAGRFTVGTESIDMAFHLGAALFPDDAADAERLMISADSAMHECKGAGTPYVVFNEGMRLRAERQHLLVLELMSAMERRQFELFYQPKALIDGGRVVSLEALIRWRHPTMGLVSPAEFIPVCEGNGMIVRLGEWIVEQACRDLRRLSDAGFDRLKVSVNVSVRQLKQGGFIEFLERSLRDSGTDPARLIIEMTESMVMEDLDKGRQMLLGLKDLGVSLALDDFGAGYSSMTYLQHLPLDSLKIDKSLVDGMVDERAVHVVQTVINLAQGLSLKTIAEGVETEAQRALLGRLGCDMIQGYLLSRPQPLPVIVEWLGAQPR